MYGRLRSWGWWLQQDLRHFFPSISPNWTSINVVVNCVDIISTNLAGGFKYFSCSSLPGEMIQFDYIFWDGGMGWNHQPEMSRYQFSFNVMVECFFFEVRTHYCGTCGLDCRSIPRTIESFERHRGWICFSWGHRRGYTECRIILKLESMLSWSAKELHLDGFGIFSKTRGPRKEK